MKIGVDAGCLGIQDDRLKVGVYQMAKSLFQELAKLDTQNTYLLYSFYPIEKNLLTSFGKNVKNVVVKPDRGWTKIWLPLQLLKDKPDVFIGLNQSLPLKLPLQTYKTIVVIHDIFFESYPKLYPGSYRKLHRESKTAAINANTIIVPSQATKKDVDVQYGIPKERITVIYEGIRTFPKGKQDTRYKIQDTRYFLFVGALKPQKNIPMLLNAFSKISNIKYPISNIQLLIVGGDKWKDKKIDNTFKKLPEEVKKRIKFLGTVNDDKLVNLYKNALAFVCPSLSEGFGLTFLEAMSFGIPVIGPNKGAVPEIIGKAGILVEPANTKEIAKAMENMLDTKIHEKYASKALSQASKFSWEKFAKSFLHAIIS